jgi:hypothetical protein
MNFRNLKIVSLLLFLIPVLSFNNNNFTSSTQEDQIPADTKLVFPEFTIIIKGYFTANTQLSEDQIIFKYAAPERGLVDTTEIGFILNEDDEPVFFAKKDTLHLYGESGIYIQNKYLQIIPNDKSDKYKVTCWLGESITEQFDQSKIIRSDTTSSEDYIKALETWDKNKVSWYNLVKYKDIKDSSHFYKMPSVGVEVFDGIKKKMNLRDTLVDLSGESPNIATVVYKEKPCYHGIINYIIQIQRTTKNKVSESKYIFFTDSGID